MRGARLSALMLRVIALATVIVLAPPSTSTPRTAEPPRERAQYERISTINSDKSIVRLPAKDGMLATSDLLAGLSQVAGLELSVIGWLLPDGQLVVLMADHQTTGGYPRVANVAEIDLPLVAQLGADDHVRFELIEHGEAEKLLVDREHQLAILRTGLRLMS